MKNLLIVIALFLTAHTTSYSKQKRGKNPNVSVPSNIPNLLFSLRRNLDNNVVCYQLNMRKNGELDQEEPIHVFWKEVDGKIIELNYLQKKLAYGVRVTDNGQACFEVRSVAFPERPMWLKKGSGNRYGIYVNIQDRECLLTNIFIEMHGGSKLNPQVRYIELRGEEPGTGKVTTERILFPRS